MLTQKWQKIMTAKMLLGLRDQASLQEIKAAYRKLAREYHPDLAPKAEKTPGMREINAAYAVLLEYSSTFRFPLVQPEGGA